MYEKTLTESEQKEFFRKIVELETEKDGILRLESFLLYD